MIFFKNGSLLLLLVATGANAHLTENVNIPATIVQPLLSEVLTDYPDKEALMLSVVYPPGGSDPVHRHDAIVFVYVLEGSIIMGVEGKEPVTLTAGQTFSEKPDDVHTLGRNASDTEPAKFLVFFVKDRDKAPVILVH